MIADVLMRFVQESGFTVTQPLENLKKDVTDCEDIVPLKTVETLIGVYYEEIQRAVDTLGDDARPKAMVGQMILQIALYEELEFNEYRDEAIHDLYAYSLNMGDTTKDVFYQKVVDAIASQSW